MAGFDPNQPRDEKGLWTATRAARKAAGLAYEVESLTGKAMIHMFAGGSKIDEIMSQKFLSQASSSGDLQKVIFNTETKTWHIAEASEKEQPVDHGDFLIEALQGASPEVTEEIQVRGFLNFSDSEMYFTMYDFTDMVEEIGWNANPLEQRRFLAKIKDAQKIAEGYTLYYLDQKSNRTKRMKLKWISMSRVFGE